MSSFRPHGLRSLLVATAALLACAASAQGTNARGTAARDAVIGGMPAPDGSLPSAAYILDLRGRVMGQCTGTVVAPSLVLTAGHCAENMRTGTRFGAGGYRVLTGQVEWSTGKSRVSTVIGVIPYPGFARRVDAGDAALLVLSAPVAASPIALAGSFQKHLFNPGTTATIAGWGRTSYRQHALTDRLQLAHTVVQPASWCKRHARPFYPRWEICTIDPGGFTTGGCEGDSGGPLTVPGKVAGEVVEVGISVHVYGRCSTRTPTVYTRVDALKPWLRSWIAAYRLPAARQPSLVSQLG